MGILSFSCQNFHFQTYLGSDRQLSVTYLFQNNWTLTLSKHCVQIAYHLNWLSLLSGLGLNGYLLKIYYCLCVGLFLIMSGAFLYKKIKKILFQSKFNQKMLCNWIRTLIGIQFPCQILNGTIIAIQFWLQNLNWLGRPNRLSLQFAHSFLNSNQQKIFIFIKQCISPCQK